MPDLPERLKSALGDRYAVEREVGRGGMAVVLLAEDLKHHSQVALKVLHLELTKPTWVHATEGVSWCPSKSFPLVGACAVSEQIASKL